MPPTGKSHAESSQRSPRPTPLLGFREPTLAAGELTLPVLTAHGEWHALVATLRDWRIAVELLLPHLPVLRDDASATAVAPVSRRQTPAPAPRAGYGECAKKCAIAWADLTADLTQRAWHVAEKHGVRDASFSNWISVHHPRELGELRRAAGISRSNAPITKPNGRLL